MKKISAAARISLNTQSAFSYDHYAPGEWSKVISGLLKRHYTEQQIEAILRSTHMRHAGQHEYGKDTAEDFFAFMRKYPRNFTSKALAKLVDETFGE